MDANSPLAAQPTQAPPQEGEPLPSFQTPDQAQSFFTNPKAMYAVAQLAAKYKQPETMKWLELGHRAAQENVITATQHLLAGDGDGAVKAFNQSGRFNDAQSATQNEDGTWTIARKSGQSVTLDPNKLMSSFLSPKEFAEQQYRRDSLKQTADYHQRSLDIQQQQANQQSAYQKGMLDHYQRSDESQQALREARITQMQSDFAHKLELLGVKNEAAAALAAAKGAGKNDAQAFRAKLVEEIIKAQPDAKPDEVAAKVDYLVRDSFTGIYPSKDGKFDVASMVGGQPVVLGSFPTHEQAVAARASYVTGKNPTAPAGAAAGAKPKAAAAPPLPPEQDTARAMRGMATPELQAMAASGKPIAKYAQAELDRRAQEGEPAPAAPAPAAPAGPAPSMRYPSIRRTL